MLSENLEVKLAQKLEQEKKKMKFPAIALLLATTPEVVFSKRTGVVATAHDNKISAFHHRLADALREEQHVRLRGHDGPKHGRKLHRGESHDGHDHGGHHDHRRKLRRGDSHDGHDHDGHDHDNDDHHDNDNHGGHHGGDGQGDDDHVTTEAIE